MTDTEGSKPRPPTGLGARARRFWREMVADLDFAPHELVILEAAAREVDVIERLENALKDAPLVVPGSKGQDVAHPLLPEIRHHRAAFAALARALKVPDDTSFTRAPSARSRAASVAAKARWGIVTDLPQDTPRNGAEQ